MRSVGIRQFRDQAIALMKLGETIRIEQNGEPIGFFVPVPTPKRDRQEMLASLDRVGEAVGRVLALTRLSEEEMLARVTPDNLYPELDTGPPVGNEGW